MIDEVVTLSRLLFLFTTSPSEKPRQPYCPKGPQQGSQDVWPIFTVAKDQGRTKGTSRI